MRVKTKYLILLTQYLVLILLSNIATTTAVENEIPNVSNVVKKTDYNTKISEIENKTTTDHEHGK